MLHKIQMGMTPEYLLGMIDADGRERPSAPVIVRGDAELLRQVIKTCPHKHKYTSGLLMDEMSWQQLGGRNFVEKLMDDFEEVMFPGLPKESYAMIWVVHPRQDKKLELNYCVANFHLPSGKALTPYYDRTDRKRFAFLMEQQNLLYGLSNPNDPDRQKSLQLKPALPKEKQLAVQMIHRAVEHAIEKERVHDRESLLEFLGGTYEINRQGKDYISIRDSSGRLLRLKGAYYDNGFKAEKVTPRISEDPQKTKDRLVFVTSELERLCALRQKYLAERYQPKLKTKDQENTDHEKPNTRRSLRRRILGTFAGIGRRAERLLREITPRTRASDHESQPTAGGTSGASARYPIKNSPSLAGDYLNRQPRHRASNSEDGVHAHHIHEQRAEQYDEYDIPATHNGFPLFTRFLRHFSRRVLRLSGDRGNPTASAPSENHEQRRPEEVHER